MSDSDIIGPIGGGIYGQFFFIFGGSAGLNANGNPVIGVFTQVGAGAGASGGVSYTFNEGFSGSAAVGLATPSGLPGMTASVLYDFVSGHTYFNVGGGVADFAEGGFWTEFGSLDDFKKWYNKEYGEPVKLPERFGDPDTSPGGDDEGEPGTAPTTWPPAPPAVPRDPLVLDLDGDGVELISLEASVAHFDYQNDGFAEKTGWLKSDDGFLVHDDNRNGVVDGMSEIFGSPVEDGFTALRAFDTNGDGAVDVKDARFVDLRIWRDLDGNGLSEAGEISSLEAHRIASINVDAIASTTIRAGNQVAFEGAFTFIDGSVGQAEAILFNTNPANSRWNMPDGFEASASAKLLPNLKGYGLLPDLVYSMTIDGGLRDAVEDYVLSSPAWTAEQIRSEFENLLFKWAQVSDTPSEARGEYVDGKVVAFLEKYVGSAIFDTSDNKVSEIFGPAVISTFNSVVDVLAARFLSQAITSALLLGQEAEEVLANPLLPLSLLAYDGNLDRFSGDLDRVVDAIIEHAPPGAHGKLEYYAKIVPNISGLKYEYFNNDEDLFRSYWLAYFNKRGDDGAGILKFAFAMRDTGTVISATDGNDVFKGTRVQDTILMGKGDDTIDGGVHFDTYIYFRGDGNDTINDSDYNAVNDMLIFADVSADEVTLVRNGDDVTVVFGESLPGAGNAGSVLLKNTLGFDKGVGNIVFSDGTSWDADTIKVMWLSQKSTDGDDVINGFYSKDIISGGAGNDIINAGGRNDTITGGPGQDIIDGGADDDTYIYSRGDGDDTLSDSGWGGYNDRLVLTDITSSGVTLMRSGNDLEVQINESVLGARDHGSVLLKNALGSYTGVDKIVFADGSVLNRDQIRLLLLKESSTDGSDVILGFDSDDSINGRAGDDQINGGGGNDLITGGLGNDTLSGGDRADTYVYARGDGNDIVVEGRSYDDRIDKLVFTDINPSDVKLRRNGTDLTLDIAESGLGANDAGSVTIKATLNNDYGSGIEQIHFPDGTIWSKDQLRILVLATSSSDEDDLIVGFDAADVIFGGKGNDVLIGGAGADELVGGDGDDEIHADAQDKWFSGGNGVDTLIYSGTNNFQYALAVGEFENVKAGAGNNTIWGSEENNTIFGESGDDYLFGYGGNDVLIGGAGADELVGGDGDDEIHADAQDKWFSGGNGVDTLIYSGTNNFQYALAPGGFENIKAGAGSNTIWGSEESNTIFGESGDDYLFGYGGNDILIGGAGADELVGGDGDDEIHADAQDKWFSGGNGIDTLVYAGTNNFQYALAVGEFENLKAGAGNNTIWGSEGDNIISGESGDDYLFGYGGDDILIGGAGADELVGGDGNDEIHADAEDKWVSGGNGIDTLIYTGTNNSEYALGVGEFENVRAGAGNNTIWGTSEANVINGEAGNDTLFGYEGDDILIGGHGADDLAGGAGNDSFVFKPNFGRDTIADFQAGAGSVDVLEFGTSLFADFEAVLAAAAQIGDDTVITFDASNIVTLKNVALSTLHDDDLRFVA
ncbi:calcium-binding protein [Agrobacterium cavarae]